MNTRQDEGVFKPPYISFRTLLNLVERMADGGIPPRIDRTFLSGSEGGKTQVLAALRALGFIDTEGNVTPLLTEMVKNPDNRKAIFRRLLEEHYPEPVRLGGINATQGQLQDAFKTYGISGDTMRKAVAFYLRAAEFAEVPVSPNFKTPSVQRADGTPARTTTKRGKQGARAASASSSGNSVSGSAATLPSLHPALAGVLSDLPPHGQGWTEDQKEAFKTAFTTLLDYTIPVIHDDEVEDSEQDEENDDDDDELDV